jgi:voltage-gated potassium channel
MRRRKYALTYLIVLVCLSTVMFSYVEKRTIFDSLYWTITVLSTVGFGDITPRTVLGKMLFIFDAISGISTYVYLITSWQSSLVEARLERKLWELTKATERKPNR